MKLDAGSPWPWPHCVRWGPSSPVQRGTTLNFRPISVVTKWRSALFKTPLGIEVYATTRRLLLHMDPHSPPQIGPGGVPQFSAHVYCGQTAGWIKMPVGMEVGFGPLDIVLDGDPSAPTKIWRTSPQFSAHVYCGQRAVCRPIRIDTEVGLSLGDILLDWEPAPLP